VTEIIDERPDSRTVTRLRGLAANLYRFCDSSRTFTVIRRAFPDASEMSLRACVAEWVAKRWMYRSRTDAYLSLAVDLFPPPSGRQALVETDAAHESLSPAAATDQATAPRVSQGAPV
jgi:hypothetical protein